MKKILLTLLILVGVHNAAVAQLRAAGTPVLVFDHITLLLHQPIASPDGQTIALTSQQYAGIWLIDRDGSNLRQLSEAPNVGFGMKWTPDASAIVARTSRMEDRRRSFALVEYALTGEVLQLTDFMAHMPTTPVIAGSAADVMIVTQNRVETVATQRLRRTQPGLTPPATAHANGNSIWLWDAEGTESQRFQPDADPETQYLNASASPDGRKIAFEVYGGNLFILEVETGSLTDFGPGYRATWSADGNYIAFMRNTDDGYRFLSGEIVAARADASEIVVLHAGTQDIPTNPFWDPIANRVYFNYLNSGSVLYIDVATE